VTTETVAGGAASGSGIAQSIPAMPGISGMARLDDARFIVVQDKKAFESGYRLGLVELDRQAPSIRYVPMPFPATSGGRTSDLESACRLQGRAGEFLLAESGYWRGDYGRIFHVAIDGTTARLQRQLQLPRIRDNSDTQPDGDNFEGMACLAYDASSYLILMGERGGTARYPDGVIRWGFYDAEIGSLTWSLNEVPVAAPNPWRDPEFRSIASLSIDANNQLWATATSDRGDVGPFRSLMYLVGTVTPNPAMPVSLADKRQPRRIDGYKVEGLVMGSQDEPPVIGTEDEELGGTWRELTP
ncbi:MAG: hypothetical protein AAGC71_18680, partial [Pseudomonadota bacterium]